MNDEQRRKLENEAKSWLQIKINETALDKNCAVRPNQRLEVIGFLYSFPRTFYPPAVQNFLFLVEEKIKRINFKIIIINSLVKRIFRMR